MMLSVSLLLIAAPVYASLGPFMDEPAAAAAFEAHISCLGARAFELQDDQRATELIAAEVVQACADEGVALRTALADVYRRRPALMGAGGDADAAAEHYVSGAQARLEVTIREFRSRRSNASDR